MVNAILDAFRYVKYEIARHKGSTILTIWIMSAVMSGIPFFISIFFSEDLELEWKLCVVFFGILTIVPASVLLVYFVDWARTSVHRIRMNYASWKMSSQIEIKSEWQDYIPDKISDVLNYLWDKLFPLWFIIRGKKRCLFTQLAWRNHPELGYDRCVLDAGHEPIGMYYFPSPEHRQEHNKHIFDKYQGRDAETLAKVSVETRL